MSKGPGKWQRAILDELRKRSVFYAAELLPAGYARSDYVALLRAVNVLERRGLVGLTWFKCWGGGEKVLAVSRPGTSARRDWVETDERVWVGNTSYAKRRWKLVSVVGVTR